MVAPRDCRVHRIDGDCGTPMTIAEHAAEVARSMNISLVQAMSRRPLQWPLYGPLWMRGFEVAEIAEYFHVRRVVVETVVGPLREKMMREVTLPGRRGR